jgi:hypothetical protein
MQTHRKAMNLLLLSNTVRHAIPARAGPVFIGEGDIDYVCAACGSPLSVGMRAGELAGVAFVCTCGSSSRVPSSFDAMAEAVA